MRNQFALFDDLGKALHECRLLNAYYEDCPFFIWKVYEAVDARTLSYTV